MGGEVGRHGEELHGRAEVTLVGPRSGGTGVVKLESNDLSLATSE